jgi:hypothetical protein
MTQMSNAAQISRRIAAPSLREAANARNRYFVYNFTSTTAAGGEATPTNKNDAGRAFVVTHITGIAYLSAAVAPSIIGTELAREGDASPPATVGNTLAPYSLIQVSFGINDTSPMRAPMSWRNFVGTIERPHILLFQPVIPPGADMRFTVRNGTAAAITFEASFHGYLQEA